MAANEESFPAVVSNAGSWMESLNARSWMELLNAKKKFKGVKYINVSTSFSKQKNIFVKFEYVGIDYCTKDFIGIYPKCSHDGITLIPLVAKGCITVDEDCKTGSISFTPEDLTASVDGQEYCFMYMQENEKKMFFSTKFVIDGYNTSNGVQTMEYDSLDEEYFMIHRLPSKTENDMMEQLELPMKQKEQENYSFKHYTSELNDSAEEDKYAINELEIKTEKSNIFEDSFVQRNKEFAFKTKEQCNDRSHFSMEKEVTDDAKLLREALKKSEDMFYAVEASKRLALDELKEQKDKYEYEIMTIRCGVEVVSEKLEKTLKDIAKFVAKFGLKLKCYDTDPNNMNDGMKELYDSSEKDKYVINELQIETEKCCMFEDSFMLRNEELTFETKKKCNDKSHFSMEKEATDEVKQLQEALKKSEDMLQAVEASKLLALNELKEQKQKYENEIMIIRREVEAIGIKLQKSLRDSSEVVKEFGLKLKSCDTDANNLNDDVKMLPYNDFVFISKKEIDSLKNNSAQVKENICFLQRRNEALQAAIQMYKCFITARSKALKNQLIKSKLHVLDCQKHINQLRFKLLSMQDEMKCTEATTAKYQRKSEATIRDLKIRLRDSAELFKIQYLKIRRLEKQVTNLKTIAGLNEQILPRSTSDYEKYPLSEDVKVNKLPEKCVIHFSNNSEDDVVSLKDSGKLECNDQDENKYLNIEEKMAVKNPIGPINDSDTGEYVSKLEPNNEFRSGDFGNTHLQDSFWKLSTSVPPFREKVTAVYAKKYNGKTIYVPFDSGLECTKSYLLLSSDEYRDACSDADSEQSTTSKSSSKSFLFKFRK